MVQFVMISNYSATSRSTTLLVPLPQQTSPWTVRSFLPPPRQPPIPIWGQYTHRHITTIITQHHSFTPLHLLILTQLDLSLPLLYPLQLPTINPPSLSPGILEETWSYHNTMTTLSQTPLPLQSLLIRGSSHHTPHSLRHLFIICTRDPLGASDELLFSLPPPETCTSMYHTIAFLTI